MATSTAPLESFDSGDEPEDAASTALGPREETILAVLEAHRGRVVTRTELARAAGLPVTSRRLDVHLVNVRRHVGAERLVNVRSHGWMLTG